MRVLVAPGPPLGSEAERARPVGRIGGIVGTHNVGAAAGLAAALGPGCQILSTEGENLVADWDCCYLSGKPIERLDQWQAIVESGRLAEVEGAFAIGWRTNEGAVRLARDAVGERTLYYAVGPDRLVFGSTIRAILATGLVPRALNCAAVATYLSYAYLPGPETLVESVVELLPGEVVEYLGGRTAHAFYWSLPPERVGPERAHEDVLREELRCRLEAAVARRLPRGEPVGATLSGGIDSSLVVALASRIHDAPVHTYSVSFGPDYPNELAYSSLVASHCGTQHRIVELSPPAILYHLDEAIGFLSDPIGDPLTVPNALLFREAASEIGVMLNGEGGDPCFGGPKNLPMLLAALFGDGANDPEDGRLARERSYLRAHQKCFDDLPAMLAPDVWEAVPSCHLEAQLTARFEDERWPSFVGRLMAANVTLKGAHHILPKVDAVSAPFGVLPRSPLFDRGVVELACETPPQLKLRGSTEKYLLKQAVRDLLPAAIVDRPKSGMLVPVEGWFRGPMLPQARERLLDGLGSSGLFRRDYLERLLAGGLGGLRPRHGAKIWLLLTLESWLRTTLRSEC